MHPHPVLEVIFGFAGSITGALALAAYLVADRFRFDVGSYKVHRNWAIGFLVTSLICFTALHIVS